MPPPRAPITHPTGNGGKDDLGRTNYAGVADHRDWTCNDERVMPRWDGSGILYGFSINGVRDILDGSSNTLFVGETTGGAAGSFACQMWANANLQDTGSGINAATSIPGGNTSSNPAWRYVGFSSYHPGGRTSPWPTAPCGSSPKTSTRARWTT